MFSGGKEGVIFLLNRNDMGKVEGASGGPLQRFQAGNGCGHEDCAQTLGTAFWSRRNDGVLYVWDKGDVLRAYNFINNRFVTTPAAVSAVQTRDDRRPHRFGEWLRRRERHCVGRYDSIQ